MHDYTLGIIVILGFVSYRLARLFAHDKLTEPIRKWAYKRSSERRFGGRWLNTLITCPFCLSVWFAIAGVVWYGWLIAPDWPDWAEVLLAIGAVAGVGAFLAAVDLALSVYVERWEKPPQVTTDE